MSGSGNDFVFLDAREASGSDPLERTEAIRALCDRRTGVGADGAVFLGAARSAGSAAEVRYYNSDGSRASLCGNATLCATLLAVTLGITPGGDFALDTDSGRLDVRLAGGRAQIDLQRVERVDPAVAIELEPGERRVGLAEAGVPHLVVLDDDVEAVDVRRRGSGLRRHPALDAAGANVNFVSPNPDGGWLLRTFERGVEDETLACGTGAVATAILLSVWGLAKEPVVDLVTRSGRTLSVTVRRSADGASWLPSLAGEARLVFRGELMELGGAPSESEGH